LVGIKKTAAATSDTLREFGTPKGNLISEVSLKIIYGVLSLGINGR
jgi:hypothetical protein